MDIKYNSALNLDICKDQGTNEPSSGVGTIEVFPEMTELMANSEECTPGPSPGLTLSQFPNTAHSGADMNLTGEQFTQCPSFGQWANDGINVVPGTPYEGVQTPAD